MLLPLDQLVAELKTMPYTMMTVIVIALAVGYGHLNHAKASEVKELTAQISNLTKAVGNNTAVNLENAMRDIKRRICETDNQDDIRAWEIVLDNYQAQYKAIKGERYLIRACE